MRGRRLREPVLEADGAGLVGEERRVAALARALGAEDQQVGAGEHRPGRGVRDPVRGGRGERVGHRHALEAELLPQQSVDDRAREGGRPLRAVELGIDRGGDHHELHAGPDRAPERQQALVELPGGGSDHDPPLVGVPAREAEAGEVLRGRRDPVRLQAADEGAGPSVHSTCGSARRRASRGSCPPRRACRRPARSRCRSRRSGEPPQLPRPGSVRRMGSTCRRVPRWEEPRRAAGRARLPGRPRSGAARRACTRLAAARP